jgi:hypothetical protein
VVIFSWPAPRADEKCIKILLAGTPGWSVVVFELSEYTNQCEVTTVGVSGQWGTLFKFGGGSS